MKKILGLLLPCLGILVLAGCSSTTPVSNSSLSGSDNSGISISGNEVSNSGVIDPSFDVIIDTPSLDQNSGDNNDQNSGAIETQNSGAIETQNSGDTQNTTIISERYWTLQADQYTISLLQAANTQSGSQNATGYTICPLGNTDDANCFSITQSAQPFAQYVTQYDTTYDQGTYYSDLVGKKTRTCGQYIMEREICYIDTASGSLSAMVEDVQGGRTYDAKDVLKLIDFTD